MWRKLDCNIARVVRLYLTACVSVCIGRFSDPEQSPQTHKHAPVQPRYRERTQTRKVIQNVRISVIDEVMSVPSFSRHRVVRQSRTRLASRSLPSEEIAYLTVDLAAACDNPISHHTYTLQSLGETLIAVRTPLRGEDNIPQTTL